MTEFEIMQSFKLKGVSMIIDRKHMQKYGGLFREIEIFSPSECRVDFTDKESKLSHKGGGVFWFEFSSFEEMIRQLEIYTGKRIASWKRYFTEAEIFNNESPEWNEKADWELFKRDFSRKMIELPQGFVKMEIKDLYWQMLYNI